ncbi:unnamed protein product [Fusarium equiseti]|uniref:Uncharacterized protein n=1 Tax=Fusarium equiseti TaxID=61235 RepID=A0A8J2JEF8_FUSEQ|nr:unnamed protein product [Fusarium equiseti]
MRTGAKLPDGNTVYPAQDILPHSINVREVGYREHDPIRQQLAELGKEYADNLFKFDSAEVPDVAVTGTQAGETSKDNSEIMMSFGVHREAVITASDPRTIEIFNKKGSSLYGNMEKLERHFTKVADTLPHTKRRKENVAKASCSYDVELGVEHIEHLLRESGNGGLNYIWEKCAIDKDLSSPAERDAKKGFGLYGDKKSLERRFTNLLILNSMAIEWPLSVLTIAPKPCCGSGMFLSWHPSVSVPEQTMARLIRIGQGRPVRWELLKTKCTYYGNIEQREIAKSDIQYHSDHCTILGHVFSTMALALMLATDEEQHFWTRNIKHAVEIPRRMADPNNDNCRLPTVEEAEKFLSSPDRDKVGKKLKMMFKEVQPRRVEERRMKVEEGSVDELADAADLTTPKNEGKRDTIGIGAVPSELFDKTEGQEMSAKACVYFLPLRLFITFTNINHTQQQTSSLRTHLGLSKVAEVSGQIEDGALDPTVTPPKLEVIAKIQDVHSLFGIMQVGEDVSNGAVHSFADFVLYGNSTLWIYLLGFKDVLLEPFLSNQYGPIHGMAALPYAMHIILAADSIRNEVVRIDIETGGIEVANKVTDLHSFTGASFPNAVNGLEIFDDYLYLTRTRHETLNRVKIDKSDHRMRGHEAIYKFDAKFTPDDSAHDKDWSAYVACWMNKLVKITPVGKDSI